MFSLPTLYKKTSTGAIQYWYIFVYENSDHSTGYIIETQYGQVDTDSPQTTTDSIFEGKNVGKKNETSVQQQAQAEAKAKWDKQKKKGYVDSKEAAEAGLVDEVIEGGVVPMLAQSYADHGHKIVFPAFVQPKLDGIRCIAIVKGGKCTLWTRTRKPITSMPHIVAQLEKLAVDVTLDGELYNHALKSNFERIVSMVRQDKPDPGHTDVQYHVYDLVNEDSFDKRSTKLRYLKESWFDGFLVKVDTHQVENEAEALTHFDQWRAEGYEGAMLRNAKGLYVNKRSYDLQKVKTFDDAEFEIIGVDEGRGKLQGHVGAFVCKMSDGKQFLAKMSGDTGKLKEYFLNPSSCVGKQLTVKYQGLTGANGVPRFPVGVAIRDYE